MKLSHKIVKFGEHWYRVYPFTTMEKLEIGNAYTFGSKPSALVKITFNYVLPFKDKLCKDSDEPGLYITKDNTLHTIFPDTQTERQIYSIDRIVPITPEVLNGELSSCFKEIDPTDLKYSGNIFVPPIREGDDTGITAVRLALIAKQIIFQSYKSRFPNTWSVSNTRKSLLSDQTLTFTKLDEYCKLFDLHFGVLLFDDKDAKDSMFNNGSAMLVFNDDEFQITDPNITIVRTQDDVLPDDIENKPDEGDD